MYKIFINDKPFIIANSAFTDNSFPSFDFDEKLFETKIAEVFANQFAGVIFKCNDEELVFSKFAKHFKIIEAAGGLVFNSKNELLLIERLGVWDLPKGKIDEGETPEIAAVREVEEECGINELIIKKALPCSYHVYIYKGKFVLKCTYWYSMNSTFCGQLIPQTEENITKVEWRNFTEADINILNTYENIREIMRNYFLK